MKTIEWILNERYRPVVELPPHFAAKRKASGFMHKVFYLNSTIYPIGSFSALLFYYITLYFLFTGLAPITLNGLWILVGLVPKLIIQVGLVYRYLVRSCCLLLWEDIHIQIFKLFLRYSNIFTPILSPAPKALNLTPTPNPKQYPTTPLQASLAALSNRSVTNQDVVRSQEAWFGYAWVNVSAVLENIWWKITDRESSWSLGGASIRGSFAELPNVLGRLYGFEYVMIL